MPARRRRPDPYAGIPGLTVTTTGHRRTRRTTRDFDPEVAYAEGGVDALVSGFKAVSSPGGGKAGPNRRRVEAVRKTNDFLLSTGEQLIRGGDNTGFERLEKAESRGVDLGTIGAELREYQAAREATRERREARRGTVGFAQTILTGPRGIPMASSQLSTRRRRSPGDRGSTLIGPLGIVDPGSLASKALLGQ